MNTGFVDINVATEQNELAHGYATPARLLPYNLRAIGWRLINIVIKTSDAKTTGKPDKRAGKNSKSALDQPAERAGAKPFYRAVEYVHEFAETGNEVRDGIVAAVVAGGLYGRRMHSCIIIGYMTESELSWQAPEFEATERSATWYLWSIVAAIGLIAIALWQKNILFALFIAIAEGVLVALNRGPAGLRLYTLNEDGLFVNGEPVRGMQDIAGFAFLDMGGRYIEFILKPTRKFHTYTKVLVLREREQDVIDFLSAHKPQFEYQPTMADVIARRLGL